MSQTEHTSKTPHSAAGSHLILFTLLFLSFVSLSPFFTPFFSLHHDIILHPHFSFYHISNHSIIHEAHVSNWVGGRTVISTPPNNALVLLSLTLKLLDIQHSLFFSPFHHLLHLFHHSPTVSPQNRPPYPLPVFSGNTYWQAGR